VIGTALDVRLNSASAGSGGRAEDELVCVQACTDKSETASNAPVGGAAMSDGIMTSPLYFPVFLWQCIIAGLSSGHIPWNGIPSWHCGDSPHMFSTENLCDRLFRV